MQYNKTDSECPLNTRKSSLAYVCQKQYESGHEGVGGLLHGCAIAKLGNKEPHLHYLAHIYI